jgi:hypothetical protein
MTFAAAQKAGLLLLGNTNSCEFTQCSHIIAEISAALRAGAPVRDAEALRKRKKPPGIRRGLLRPR